MERDSWIKDAEGKLGHRFRDRGLLRAALTHPSAGAEGRAFERLEFLGDAILTLLVGLHLYETYPDLRPGELTRLRASMVNRTTLAQAASQLGLPPLLRLGKGEERHGRQRVSLLAAAFEALVAALYLDRGLKTAMSFLKRRLLTLLSPDFSLDPKSELQNHLQAVLKMVPRYRLVRHWGPPHAPRFSVAVEAAGQRLGRGTGPSRRQAERAAARAALAHLAKSHKILRSSP